MAFFSEYYFDLVVAMLLFGLLGFSLAIDEYHVVIGVLVVGIMITFMLISVIILEYYFGCHAAFGLLVVSVIIFMMLVNVLLLLLGVLISETMFTCGS